jgi:ankyrin repeat protein
MAANAAHRGDLAQLETFIRKGMSVSDLDHALLLASQQGRGPCAAALCDAGADPLKHTRKAGWGQDGNPLVWAAQRGHREVLEVFFRKLPDGAHTMSRKRVKMKIIDEAVFGCTNLSTIVWLVELHEEALRMQNVYEEIPLHRACKYNAKFEIIKYLVEKTGGGLEESALTAKGESPLDLALEFSPSDEVRSWARRHPRTRLFRMFEVVPGLPASSSDSSTVVKALETASGRFVTVKGTADARQFETELSALLRLADAHIMPLLRVLIPTDYDFIDPLLSPERSEMLRWQEKVPGVRDSCTNTSAPKKKGHYAMREADGRWGQVVYIDRDACRLVWVDKTAKAELNGGSFNFHPSKLGACVTSLEHLLDAEELRKIPVGRLDMSKDLSKWQMEGCKFFLVTASEEDCRDLEREIAVGTFAGRDAARVRKCAHDTAQALHQLERHNMTHGELTTRDVVISSSMLVKLVDLNGAAEHGQPCHLKISTAFGSPQLAERVLRHKQAEPGSEWKEWIQRPENLLLATTTIDIFAFGVILHRMGIPDSPPIFLSTSSNNILEEHDLKILAYRWSEWALLHAGHIAHSGAEWAACADLAFWCMQAEPERRPQSFAEVLAHRFFSESGKLRYLNSIDEPWAALEERLTTKMHLAVEQQRPDELKQLLMDTGADRGAYYAMMQRDVSLLHRIAFHGNTEAAIVALENIDNAWPASVRAELLDIRTQLGYTAYMIACDCGHTEIAELLEAKGCTVGLRNNSGKTGADLLQASQGEYKQSILTPHNHGYKLHLSYDSLESYLAVLERMLDEDVAAGIKLWHAKQAVYHFSREQMAQLEAIVKELLPKSFDIAIHFTDLGSNNLILNTKGIRASVVGQLGGGVSVCLRSLVGFEWGQDWDKFTEAVGKALWGVISLHASFVSSCTFT